MKRKLIYRANFKRLQRKKKIIDGVRAKKFEIYK